MTLLNTSQLSYNYISFLWQLLFFLKLITILFFICLLAHLAFFVLLTVEYRLKEKNMHENLLDNFLHMIRNPVESQKCWYVWMLHHFSCVWLFATVWTVALSAPLSMGFSRQEYWNGLPCPPSGDLPTAFIYENSLDNLLHMVRNPSWKSEVLLVNRKLHLIPRILEEK